LSERIVVRPGIAVDLIEQLGGKTILIASGEMKGGIGRKEKGGVIIFESRSRALLVGSGIF
jgi:hypothetical protein